MPAEETGAVVAATRESAETKAGCRLESFGLSAAPWAHQDMGYVRSRGVGVKEDSAEAWGCLRHANAEPRCREAWGCGRTAAPEWKAAVVHALVSALGRQAGLRRETLTEEGCDDDVS